MRKTYPLISSLLASFFLISCSSTPKQADPEILKQKENLGKFMESPITKPANKNILFSLSQYYGTPQHQEFKQKRSPLNPKQKEKVYTLIYDGFEINVAEKKQNKEKPYYLRRLVVHDNVLKLPLNIKIGQKADELHKLFGQPVKVDKKNNSISYCSGSSDCVSFIMNEEKLERIIWDYQK
jgi:hypothetical protein